MLDQYHRFIIDDYGSKPVFADFLPGLSGRKGIPVWAFYCNRGQGITSFGTANKDNAIMEFYPAHTAYQLVRTHGFRTFINIDGQIREAFITGEADTRMYVGANTFSIEDEKDGIFTEVSYMTLPSESTGALVRVVRITNKTGSLKNISVLDGMPALIPAQWPSFRLRALHSNLFFQPFSSSLNLFEISIDNIIRTISALMSTGISVGRTNG